MPIYEYQCSDCGQEFEALILPQKPEASCPACQGKNLERLVSSFAVDSEAIRQANLKKGREYYAPMRKEKQMEQAKYEERVRKEEYGG